MKQRMAKKEENMEDEVLRLKNIAEMQLTHHGRIFIEEVSGRLDAERNEFEDKAGSNDDNIKKDWRYLLGRISVLKEILALPTEAQNRIDLYSQVKQERGLR
jgi:hypothetical protein